MRNSITLSTGEKACVKCFKRPVMMRRARTRTGAGVRWIPGSYCRVCMTEYVRQRRIGKIEMLLTHEEARLIEEYRASRRRHSKGRHAAKAA